MHIQAEATPNPDSLKFTPGHPVSPKEPCSFKKSDKIVSSPLAQKLLTINGVDGIYLGVDFITVLRESEFDWEILKPEIINVINDYFSDFSDIEEKIVSVILSNLEQNDDPIVQQIKEIINTRVRPAVAQDGGDIVFHSFKDGIVYLEMHGACRKCPNSTETLKSGIENMLRHYVPEVQEVRAWEAP